MLVLLLLLGGQGWPAPSPGPRAPKPGHRTAAAQPPPHHPTTPQPRNPTASPPQSDLRLAEALLVETWDNPAYARDARRDDLLVPLALVDPRQALARVRPETPPRVLVDALTQLAHVKSAAAPEFLARVAAILDTAPPVSARDAATFARAAAAARAMGDARASNWMDAAVKCALAWQPVPPEKRRGEDYYEESAFGAVVRTVALTDRDKASALVEHLNDEAMRRQVRVALLASLARVDPAGAVRLLDAQQTPAGTYPAGETWWLSAAEETARAMASRDRAAAEALVARLPMPGDAVGMARRARYLPPTRASELRREAIRKALATPVAEYNADQNAEGLRVLAEMAELVPPGPQRKSLCAAALRRYAGSYGDPHSLARIAHALEPVDPSSARALLEDELANDNGQRSPGYFYSHISLALAPLDPARAVAVARRVPLDGQHNRRWVAYCLGCYLTTPREERAGITFDALASGGYPFPDSGGWRW